MDQDTMDLAAAAALLHAEPATVAGCARSGELPGTHIGKGWVFLREDVLAFLRERIAADTAERRARQHPPPLGSVAELGVKSARRPRRAAVPPLPPPVSPAALAHPAPREVGS